MKRKKKKAVLAVLACLTILAGCSNGSTETNASPKETVIPIMFLVNPDSGENENEELVDDFNEAYKGTYRLDVEWITDTAEGYRARIKTLNGLDKLPAVITDVGFDADFYDLLVQNGRLVNLEPYITSDAGWKKAFGERELDSYRETDKGVYLAPSGNASLSYGGFYYNKELFTQAGITKFPEDWDSFFVCLETLKGNGITPLAIHGGSAYWTALLMATGYAAGTEEGLAFLETQYPQDYQNKSAADMFAMLKRLYEYAAPDALHIERTEAAKRFMQGEAAVTANGGWMILNFTDEVNNKIGFAPFPGNILMKDMRMSTWAVTAGYPQEVTEGAAEFIKFRALRDERQEAEYFGEQAEHVVEQEYKQAVLLADTMMPNYQLKWESAVQEEFLVNALPLYIEDEMTQEAFLGQLNEAVREINAEK